MLIHLYAFGMWQTPTQLQHGEHSYAASHALSLFEYVLGVVKHQEFVSFPHAFQHKLLLQPNCCAQTLVGSNFFVWTNGSAIIESVTAIGCNAAVIKFAPTNDTIIAPIWTTLLNTFMHCGRSWRVDKITLCSMYDWTKISPNCCSSSRSMSIVIYASAAVLQINANAKTAKNLRNIFKKIELQWNLLQSFWNVM